MIRAILVTIVLTAFWSGISLSHDECYSGALPKTVNCNFIGLLNSQNLNGKKINEAAFNDALANFFGANQEVEFEFHFESQNNENGAGKIRIDMVTDEYVIEGGLDKRSSLDSVQQATFASILSNKMPAIVIYDVDGKWGKIEHRILTVSSALGIKFFWVSDDKIFELH